MKKFSEEELQEIEEFAACLMTNKEIATIMEVESHDFAIAAAANSSAIGKALKKGRLKSKAAINKSIVEMASRGSSPAQQLAIKMQCEIEDNI